jgi:hypothetical protein
MLHSVNKRDLAQKKVTRMVRRSSAKQPLIVSVSGGAETTIVAL